MNVNPVTQLTQVGRYQLADVLEFRNEIVHPKDKPVGVATFVGLEHIERDTGTRLGADTIDLSEMTGRRARFRAGDIVYGYLRPYLNKVWIAEFDGLCSVDQYVFKIRPVADRNYVYHFLRSAEFLKTAPIDSAPGQLPRIRSGEIAATPIPLPRLDEQKRIAAILDKADQLRQKRRQAIALLDSLTQSIFLEMFGDPVSNPKGWPVQELSEFEQFLTSGSRGWAEFYADEGRPFIRIQNLKNGKLSTDDLVYVKAPTNAEARRTTVSAGDVLISITADLGRIAVVPLALDGDANINQHIALFRPKQINSFYLANFLASDGGKMQFSALNRQGVKAGLNFSDIRRLRILVPPVALQAKFEQLLISLEARKDSYLSARIDNESLFASLHHRAFSGQL